jgi:hypothetical protein
MSRFYGTMTNSRGREVTAMSPDYAHLCSWNAGVKVMPAEAGDKKNPVDSFTIWATYGSSGNGPTRLIGTLYDTAAGPVFVAAGEELTEDAYDSAVSG